MLVELGSTIGAGLTLPALKATFVADKKVIRYFHSCLELAALIKTSTNSPSLSVQIRVNIINSGVNLLF